MVDIQSNDNSHEKPQDVRNSTGEIYRIDKEDIDAVCNHYSNLSPKIKSKHWEEEDLFKYDKSAFRAILRNRALEHIIPRCVAEKYMQKKLNRVSSSNKVTLNKIKARVKDLVNACCRPSSELQVKVHDSRFAEDEILPSKKSIMTLMVILSNALQRMRDNILNNRNSKIENYDGKTIDGIITEMGLSNILPRGDMGRREVTKAVKRKILDLYGINEDEYKSSHRCIRQDFSEGVHILHKPHEVEVVKASLVDQLQSYGIQASSQK